MNVESSEPIKLTRDGAVATIWVDRPGKRNAMSYAMWVSLEEVALRVAADSEVRVVVVRGAGDLFCAGADISELSANRDDAKRHR